MFAVAALRDDWALSHQEAPASSGGQDGGSWKDSLGLCAQSSDQCLDFQEAMSGYGRRYSSSYRGADGSPLLPLGEQRGGAAAAGAPPREQRRMPTWWLFFIGTFWFPQFVGFVLVPAPQHTIAQPRSVDSSSNQVCACCLI